jgi:hypothetical protein
MAAAKIDLKARLGRKSGAPETGIPGAGMPAQGMPGPAPVPGGMVPGASVPPGYGAPVGGASGSMPAPVGSPSAAPPGFGGGGFPGAGSRAPAAPAGGAGNPGAAPQAGRGAIPGPGGRPMGPAGVLGPSIPPPPGFGPKPTPQAAAPAQSVAPAQFASAQPRPARPTAIKLEMGEEVLQAQKAGRSKTMILAAATCVVGLVIGYGIGGLAKGNEGAKAAVAGAELLVKEIDEANTKVSELNDVLKAAAAKVRENEFPSAEIEKLGGLDIPFDGTNLTNKNIGRFNASAVTMLLQYSNSVAAIEDQRDKLRRLFGAVKESFEAAAKERTNPTVHWAVTIADGPGGKWAKVQPLADKAFAVADKSKPGYKWPADLEVGKTKLELYSKGDPEASNYFPIDPGTEKSVCPENLQFRLMGALLDLGNTIAGDSTPGHEVDGVIAQGDKLMEQLKKIGGG